MIVKSVIDICIKSKQFHFFNTDEGQWLTDGVGVYPLFGAPHLDANTVRTLYNVSDSKKNKISFRNSIGLPKAYDFGDIVDREQECKRVPIDLYAFGCRLIPFKCSSGVVYFDAAYFVPLKDIDPNMLKVFERVSTSGSSYYVVKDGMCLVALIMPVTAATTEEMVNQLQNLADLTRLVLVNKNEVKEPTLEDLCED